MTTRPDPLQLPETAGPELISRPMATWLGWVAATIVVDVVVSIAAALAWPHLEAAFLTFGAGIGWAALTPRVIRRIGRWVRG